MKTLREIIESSRPQDYTLVVNAKDLKDFAEKLISSRSHAGPVSRKKAMQMLGIGPTTLYKLCKNNTLHPIHIGRKVFFYEDEINYLLSK